MCLHKNKAVLHDNIPQTSWFLLLLFLNEPGGKICKYHKDFISFIKRDHKSVSQRPITPFFNNNNKKDMESLLKSEF